MTYFVESPFFNQVAHGSLISALIFVALVGSFIICCKIPATLLIIQAIGSRVEHIFKTLLATDTAPSDNVIKQHSYT
jgi:hypothetical protein